MKNIISSFVKEFIKVVIIVAIAVPTIALFAAWTGPTGAPPTNNADAPVNVGVFNQIKMPGSDCGPTWLPGKDPDKCGGLSVGTFVSQLGTLLAKDGGNVGIGIGEDGELPQAKLHVAGGDAIFEGQIQIKGGLPEKDKVLVSSDNTGAATWETITADMLIPQGYEEVYFNAGEDVYGGWRSDSKNRETCGRDAGIVGNPISILTGDYACSPEETKTCVDTARDGCSLNINNQCLSGGNYISRNIECRTAKILRKNTWQYVEHKYTGKALIIDTDFHGSSESCTMSVYFSNADGSHSCSNPGYTLKLGSNGSLSGCKNWFLEYIKGGVICRFPFQDRIRSFNGTWDIGGLEGGGTGALELNFVEVK